jgi:2-C-methyl-D-erythritol 4-phosphate cytidylyltransferase
VPKAFVELAGRPMLEWSELALRAAGIDFVRVVPRGYDGIEGGATRSASVRAGLAALPAVDAVIVHDAARPLVAPELFGRCLEALQEWDGVVAAARVVDTIRDEDGGTLDRSRLWAVQTPQAFRREWLERALAVPEAVLAAATDDASLVEAAGGRVGIVEAPAPNFKVTTAHDLAVAEWLLSQRC